MRRWRYMPSRRIRAVAVLRTGLFAHRSCNALPNEISSAECGARNGFRRAHECGQANPRQFCDLVGGLCASIAADSNPLVAVCH